jgi:O-antigen ligase
LSSATFPLAARRTEARTSIVSRATIGLTAAPSVLLLLGALVGFLGTLDADVARERAFGLLGAGVLSVLAVVALQRTQSPARWLVGAAALALLGSVWIISATGADVFRGAVGAVLSLVFRPTFGLFHVTDPVDVANTRFIVGYNGLADLCLVAIFGAGAVLLERPARWLLLSLSAVALVALVLLVGAGSRGGLIGLAAGICTIGLFAWPRRYALLVMLLAPLAAAALALGVMDKGLEFSSTAGRVAYWTDLARLLVEYPLTGVGLGVGTANQVALAHEINPDPERIFYAHNTFVQAYLEQGPLGALGLLLVPVLALGAALVARRGGVVTERRALLVTGLGVVGGLEAHGLTDQVLTTNVGTGLVLLGLAACLAALARSSVAVLARWGVRGALLLVGVCVVLVVVVAAVPAGRAQVLLNLGGLQANRALALPAQAPARAQALADAEATLALALALAPEHAGVLRDIARVRSARYDDSGALGVLRRASQAPGLDAFDLLQIAHLYRDAGFARDAYAWAARAYAVWGRSPEDAVMRVYAENTLLDDEGGHRARTLATQAEAAMRARSFGLAADLFQQALTFAPDNAYLHDRVGAALRAVEKYGPGSA